MLRAPNQIRGLNADAIAGMWGFLSDGLTPRTTWCRDEEKFPALNLTKNRRKSLLWPLRARGRAVKQRTAIFTSVGRSGHASTLEDGCCCACCCGFCACLIRNAAG